MRKFTLIAPGIIAAATLCLWVPMSGAYETYSAGEVMHPAGSDRCRETDTSGCAEPYGNCQTCHGHFRATDEEDSRPYLRDSYIANTDGEIWDVTYQEVNADAPEEEIGLHNVHRHVIVDKLSSSRCDTCHQDRNTVGRYPVKMDESASTFLEPISCMGCHGREEDAGNDSISGGYGAGLRQHHTNAGINTCKTCHSDADPENYTPVGENVMPPYYGPNDEFPNIPTDPCNFRGAEDYAAGPKGLDNDGDGRYDSTDSDCRRMNGSPTSVQLLLLPVPSP